MPRHNDGFVYILSHVHEGSMRVGHFTKVGFSHLDPGSVGQGRGKGRIQHLSFSLEAFGYGPIRIDYVSPYLLNARSVEEAMHSQLKLQLCHRREGVGSATEIFDVDPEKAVGLLTSLILEIGRQPN